MANYIYLIGSRAEISDVAARFPPDDHRLVVIDEDEAEVFIATDAAAAATAFGYLTGYVVDHSRRTLQLGASGRSVEPDGVAEGCFVSIARDGREVRIRADWFGLMPRMYFSGGGVVGVSDSLASLCEIRRMLGLEVRIDEDAIASRAWSNGIADQLHQERTPIEGVRYCLPSSTLTVRRRRRGLRTHVAFTSPVSSTKQVADAYPELLAAAADRIGAVTAAWAGLPGIHVALSVSGGLDSRVILAALRRSGHIGTVDIRSSPTGGRDLEIASRLADEIGFRLNGPMHRSSAPAPDRLTLWGVHNAGIYDPLYSVNTVQAEGSSVTFGGHGAELCKGQFGWRTIRSIAQSAGSTSRVFERACDAGLRPLRLRARSRRSSEWYYWAYRGPIHSGRFLMSGPFGIRPLFDRELFLLARSRRNPFPEPGHRSFSIIADLLVQLDPELAMMELATRVAGLDRTHVESRLRALPRQGPITPYSVSGSLERLRGGVPDLLSEAAAARGFTGGLRRDTVCSLVERSWEQVGADLRPLFEPLRALALRGLEDPIRAGTRASRAAGKLMTFRLAD